MEIYKLSFITIVLFMIHEFEEIIFVKKFIEKNKVVKDMKNELFVKKKESYPSTETTSLMIAEEFIILSTLLFIASKFSMYEIVLSLDVFDNLSFFISTRGQDPLLQNICFIKL